MTLKRAGLVAGIAVLFLFVALYFIASPKTGGENPLAVAILMVVAIAGLIACGNLLYGRRSPYARVQARKRPAQHAHDHAADLAADARRATAEAARRGERYCPLDPVHTDAHSHQQQAATNGRTPSPHHAPPS